MIRLRNISILLLLMLLGMPMVSKAKDAFYIQPFNIVPGDTKTISLNLDNENVYRGFQTDIVLPEGLSIVKNANNSLAISLTHRASSFGLSSNEVGDRTLRLLGYSAQYETISGDNGALVNIQVKASSDFKGGYVQLKNTIFSNENNQDVSMDDSQVLVQTKEQNLISVADGELTAGKGKAFALQLTNETSLTACQFDVVVPAGLSLDLNKCSVAGRCSASHQLSSKSLGNGRYRFVCMAMDNTLFSGHAGAILNLWVDVEASVRGNKTVKLENVVFSDAKAQTYRLEPISFDVNVTFVVASSIKLSESSFNLQVDDNRTLTATVLPENCTDKNVIWESSNDEIAIVDANGNVVAKSEGQCVIKAYSADRSVSAECQVSVTKIPLTVTAENVSRQYGDDNPPFKITYSGFKEGDSEASFPEPILAQTEATQKSAVGNYEITLSGGASNKYSFNYVAGTLTITKAPLTISAGNYTKKQGDAMPTFKASYDGFKNGETESVLTKQPMFSTDATEASSPAEYAVNVSGAEAENYEISYQPGTLTVTEADAVIIRAKSYTRQYGDANPVFEYEVEGAALEGTPELTCSAVANSPVGTYTIELSKGSVKNYNVHFENGTMTITKAPLTISAGNYTKKQGDAMPTFKASYDGFKNGETESVLTKQPMFSTDANEASSPAEYAVNVSSAEAENYEISYQPGTLTVTEADAVIIRAKSYTRLYGDANPVFEYEVEGAALEGTPELTCSAVANSPVGTYTIELSKGSVRNYNVHFENGTLTITKAPLTISAGNYTKKQGDAMPAFKASYDGFKNGETESVLTKQPMFSTDANEASSPAEYAVNVSGAEAENYEITYLPGTLTVTEADAVIIRAKSYTRQYGDANPSFEYEVEGAALEGTPELTCSAVANSPVGTYTIELSKGSVRNYNVHFENGTLTITKAPLTISAGNYTKKQGDAMPAFKASYDGFKNGETESVLTKQPVFSTDANEASSPAEYAVNVSNAEAENYEITYLPGTLTVTEMPAPILSVVNKELQISTELADAIIYYTLDGTNPDENSKVYSAPISLYASCMIKAIVVKNGVKSKIAETEYHDAQYPDIVKVGDLITANIINNGEEDLLMAFRVTSVFPFEVTMIHRSNYKEGWNNEQITGDIEVPSSVTANGISYSVKRIGDSALAYTPKAASLKLNEGLEYIDGSAFRCFGQLKMKELVVPNSVKVVGIAFVTECNSLNTIVLGTGVERLQRDVFWGIGALKEIYSLNSIPPVCDVPDQTFVDIPDDVTLYVPVGSKEAYETAPGWNHFAGHIVEINPTAIKPVVISVNVDALWYNLQGVKSSEKPTAPGIYIHGGKKVVIK